MIIKIAFFIDKLPIGGTEGQLFELIKRLDKSTFKIYLFLLKNFKDGLERDLDCNVIYLNFKNFGNFFLKGEFLNLISLLRDKDIDIIQTFFPDSSVVGLLSGKLAGTQCVITSRRDMGYWHNKPDKLKNFFSSFMSDEILVNSISIKTHLIKNEKLNRNKINVISNGIDANKFKFNRIDDRVKNIGVISNFNRYVKRLDVFIEAMKILSFRYKNIEFIIVGKIEEWHWEYKIPEDIISRFLFLGPCSYIPEVIKRFDIGVVCSDSEGFSNVILEYMASGVPCVCTNSGGNREIIYEGKNGFLFEPGDFLGLAKKISLLIENPRLRKSIVETSYEIIQKKYSWINKIKEYEKFYRQIIKNSSNKNKF